MNSIATPTMWWVFASIVVISLFIDTISLRTRGNTAVSIREATLWSIFWVAVSMLFNAWLWWSLTPHLGEVAAKRHALEFFTGYLVEKSLAVDNIFVFLLIFKYFAVPPVLQRNALVLGVIGAIVLRGLLIVVGAWLLAKFHWLMIVFGLFLVATGVKMWWAADKESDLSTNPLLLWLRARYRFTENFEGNRWFVRREGKRFATPMLLVIVFIGVTDLIFAVDSIPAIFAITPDPYLVLTSNLFAVLGLRAMYFLLADLASKLHLLTYGLSIILVFIGTKMMIVDFYKVPIGWSLGFVFVVLCVTVILSLMSKPKDNSQLSEMESK